MFSLVMIFLFEIRREECEVAILGWVLRSKHVVRVDDTRAALYA